MNFPHKVGKVKISTVGYKFVNSKVPNQKNQKLKRLKLSVFSYDSLSVCYPFMGEPVLDLFLRVHNGDGEEVRINLSVLSILAGWKV